MSDVASLVAGTPASRDRYVDFLRVASLAGVMIGHFFLAVIVIEEGPAGDVWDTDNLVSWFWWARAGTWLLQVMPVFFVVGGFAHAVAWRSLAKRGGGYADFVHARISRLVLPALAFVAVGMVASVAVELLLEVGETAAFALQIAGQLLWFIGIYLIAAALAPAMLRVHERFGWRALAALAGSVVAVDVLRLGLDVPHVMWLNFAFVWLAIHQLGFFYADGVANRRGVKLGWTMLGLGTAASAHLIWLGPYGDSLISYPGEKLSNLAPPTVVLLTFAVAQAGALLVLRPALTRWLQGRRPWSVVIAAGSVAMTAFLWHFVALMGMYGLLYAVGAPVFGPPGTGAWWALRLPLFVLFLVLVGLCVLTFRRFDRPPARSATVGRAWWRMVLAGLASVSAILGMIGFAVVGFRGVLEGFTARAATVEVTAWQAFALVLLAAVLARLAVARRG